MINYRKIAAVIAGVTMLGSTVALAAAANYPAPFVNNGMDNVAIVSGSTAASSDLVASFSINTDLASRLASQTATGGSTGTNVNVNGEAVSLNSGSTKVWMNTSINTAKTVLTKTDLPTVLKEFTFSGNVDSKITSTIAIGANKVTFAKQPSSNDDPVIGVTTVSSTAGATPLYNLSATMPAINFTHADSEGQDVELFGQKFTVASSTDLTSIVLFKSAQKITLSNEAPTTKVTVSGVEYTLELVSASETSATIKVTDSNGNSESKEINENSSKKIQGLSLAVTSATSNNFKYTASVLAGADQITLTTGTQATKGTENDPIDGTLVTITGGTNATTAINIAVNAPDSSNDAILPGTSFVDPIFGTFKIDFTGGLSSNLNDSSRNVIKVDKSGDKGMSLTMTNNDGVAKTFDFVYNATTTFLGDSNSYRIKVQENANLSENNYTMIGNEDYGHLVQVKRIYNNTGTDYTKDAVTFTDVISGDTYETTFTNESYGLTTIDGRQYSLHFWGSGDAGYLVLKYPTSDSAATERIIYPTIEAKGASLVSLYEPLKNISLTGITKLWFPDGDGYTGATLTYLGTDGHANWTVSGAGSGMISNSSVTNSSTLTIGRLTYHLNMTTGTGSANLSSIYLVRPGSTTEIAAPGIVVFDDKDTLSNYEAIAVDVEAAAAGTSTDALGVNTIGLSSPTWYNATLTSDSDLVDSVDYYGTHIRTDSNTASQKVVTISYPDSQVYANIYAAANAAEITASGGSSGGGSVKTLGSVYVYDSQIDSVSSKNLIVVGGNCVNTVAARLLGATSANCGSEFETITGVMGGQYLIQTLASPYAANAVATLVAGRYAEDTTKAAKFLTTQPVDTTVGKKYKGTSETVATVETVTS